MGQYWCLINLDKRQSMFLGKLGGNFSCSFVSRSVTLGRIPPVRLLPYLEHPPGSPSPNKVTGIDSLSNETVDEVFENLPNFVECLRLALTSRRYWNLARRHIRRNIELHLQHLSWAGDRVVCLGDYADVNDYPPALQNAEDFRGVNLYHLAREEFRYPPDLGTCGTLGGYVLHHELGKCLWGTKGGLMVARPILVDCVTEEDVEMCALVLRNLSKHEYVRYDALLPLDSLASDKWGCQVDLALAAQSQICWSSDPSIAMCYEGGLHRGAWAGDRLDIAPVEELKELENGQDGEVVVWTDRLGHQSTKPYSSSLHLNYLDHRDKTQYIVIHGEAQGDLRMPPIPVCSAGPPPSMRFPAHVGIKLLFSSKDMSVHENLPAAPRTMAIAIRNDSVLFSSAQNYNFAMGQYWYLINLDKQQSIFLGKLGECFCDSPMSIYVTLGHAPAVKLLPYFKPPPASPFPNKVAGIDGLPNELVDEVFEHMLDFTDCYCLALTSRRYWNLARPVMKCRITLFLQYLSWAGDRVTCMGDYAKIDDYPPALQASEDFKGVDIYELASEEFGRIPSSLGARGTLGGTVLRNKLLGCFRGVRFWGIKISILESCVPVEDVKPSSLILRNLSKHEYVRYDSLPVDLLAGIKHPGPVDLALAAFSQICWSWDPSIAINTDVELHRGGWAGDRLDIVPVAELEEVENGEDGEEVVWTDISERVAGELTSILKSEYGIN
ncbi:hypothetical protein EVG20_g2775 [Dentipellis fragilis]|uniref:F-box domain-containing protein n=1 Tax=Dentipellis fragilis TaxID=205917 RepID=A0A4Y9Z656_9AGAM|nr:hypothetical protein EVG20_g2775 [Dentipellis fragilis]